MKDKSNYLIKVNSSEIPKLPNCPISKGTFSPLMRAKFSENDIMLKVCSKPLFESFKVIISLLSEISQFPLLVRLSGKPGISNDKIFIGSVLKEISDS